MIIKNLHYFYLIFLILLIFFFFIFNLKFELKFKPREKAEKYIQFECTQTDVCGGWADRLKGILSTYAFSLITKRKFLIKMTKSCDLKNVLEPNEINWDYSQLSDKIINSSLVLNYNWNFALLKKFSREKILLSDYTAKNLISIKAYFMFSDSLSDNPYLANKIWQFGYKLSEFKIAYQIRSWYKKLFKLNKRLQIKHDLYLKKLKPSKKTKIICAQVRMGDPGHVGQTDKNASLDFWHFINNTFLNTSDKFSIFVTSDRENVKFEAKNFFPFQNVVFTDNSSLHVEKLKSQNGCNEFEKVILDFHLMQHCDIGVVSHSGFGIMSMWNRKDPFKDFYIYTKKDQVMFKKNYWNRKNLVFIKYNNLSSIFFT